MGVALREEAKRELHEAITWYENDYPGRVAVVPRFPYVLIFVIRDDGPTVYAVASDKRRPGYWKKRIEG